MEDRKKRIDDAGEIRPEIQRRLSKALAIRGVFDAIHTFAPSSDVPDDDALRLVVLPPDAGFSKTEQSPAKSLAAEYLKQRGTQPRFKQNRLLFLCADFESIARLKDHIRSHLAWQSILTDYKNNHINLDNLTAKQAETQAEQAENTMLRTVREAYRHLLVPIQDARPGQGLPPLKWEHHALNASTGHPTSEMERFLKENELLITEWAPIHLSKMLKDWFWNEETPAVQAKEVWDQTCRQLYLPRLKDKSTFQSTLARGSASADFFGFAQGQEGSADAPRYLGFSYTTSLSPTVDSSLLLVAPSAARAYAEALQAEEDARQRAREESLAQTSTETATVASLRASTNGASLGDFYDRPSDAAPSATTNHPHAASNAKENLFYGVVDIDLNKTATHLLKIVTEIIEHFTKDDHNEIEVKLDITVKNPSGFDDNLRRIIKENCATLGIEDAGFERGD